MDASVHPTISLSLISATSLNRGEKHSDNFTIGLRPGIILILIWNVEYYKFRREKNKKKHGMRDANERGRAEMGREWEKKKLENRRDTSSAIKRRLAFHRLINARWYSTLINCHSPSSFSFPRPHCYPHVEKCRAARGDETVVHFLSKYLTSCKVVLYGNNFGNYDNNRGAFPGENEFARVYGILNYI